MVMDTSKQCTRCGVEKSLSDFYVHRSAGRRGKPFSACKECSRARVIQQRKDHPDWVEENYKRWRRKNNAKVQEYGRSNYARHKEAAKRRVLAYQIAHKDQVREWRRKYAHSARGKLSHLVKEGRRRAAKLGGDLREPVPAWVVEKIIDIFGRKCVWCGGPYETLDHIYPLAILGAEAHRADNLAPACRECNSKKSAKNPKMWAAQCGVALDDILTKAAEAATN